MQTMSIFPKQSFGEWLEEPLNNNPEHTRAAAFENLHEIQQEFVSLEALIDSKWAEHLEHEHHKSNNGI